MYVWDSFQDCKDITCVALGCLPFLAARAKCPFQFHDYSHPKIMPRINVLYEGIAITKSIRKCGIFRDHDSGDATHYRVSLLVEYAFSADG
jgi:hypothetical protein